MTEIETHICSLYLSEWAASFYEKNITFADIISDIACNKFQLCQLSKDYLHSDTSNLVTIMLNARYALETWDKKEPRKMSKTEKVKNIIAFLCIVFEDNNAILESLFNISPDYLMEKFERYVLSTRPESDWGLHPGLRTSIFEQYCNHWHLS